MNLARRRRLDAHFAAPQEAHFGHLAGGSCVRIEPVERLAASGRFTGRMCRTFRMRQPVLRGCVRNPQVVMPLSCGICRIRYTVPARALPTFRAHGELSNLFTMLRLPTRKTRPPLHTVITLALRKNAPDGNRCREGDAY